MLKMCAYVFVQVVRTLYTQRVVANDGSMRAYRSTHYWKAWTLKLTVVVKYRVSQKTIPWDFCPQWLKVLGHCLSLLIY